VSEVWKVDAHGKSFVHGIEVTWVFDQGGPIMGYTSPLNIKTRSLLRYVERVAGSAGLYGPGSVVSALEVQAAELLASIMSPFLTDGRGDLRVRFFSDGSSACDAAVRVARAATGRSKFISIGYHGASPIFASPPQNAGIPEGVTADRVDLAFADTQGLMKNIAGAACVICEIPSTDEDARSFLQAVRKACDKHDAIFIMDEIVTGFRLSLGGAAQHYGVKPDLACFGKTMSNGAILSAAIGWPKLMDELENHAFYSCTMNGSPWGCAHALWTLDYLSKHQAEVYEYIWRTGEALISGLKEVGVPVVGHAPRSALSFPSEEERRAFCARMVLEHVVMDRPNYTSLAHGAREVQRTVEAAGGVRVALVYSLSR